jgi:acylaminoacyl-peptidase
VIPHRRHRTQVGVAAPRVYVIDLLEDTVEVVEPPPDGVYEGQPAFSPVQPRQLATVAWSSQYRKLGLIYCFNRPSSIYLRDLDEDVAERLSEDAIQRSPRWNGDGSRLAFLASTEQFETHDGAVELKVWSAGKVDVVVEAPLNPDYRSECPGLWSCPKLLEDCWSGDTLVVNSLWGSAPSVLLVDTKDKSITRVGDADNAHAALCVADGIAVVHTTAPEVAAGALLTVDVRTGDILASTAAPPLGVISKTLATFDAAPAPLKCDVIPVDAFEALLLREEGAEKRPLVVSVHGGPHSCTPTSYSAALAFLASRGFAILSVNYRGSTGFGKALLDSLPGNIGTQDVDDCLKAIEVCCSTHNVDRERIAVVGGSHGGFLGAHLIARSPKLFKACALRNPVTNLGAMVGSSDIPDWIACECASSGTPPGPEVLKKLFAMSPIAGIDKVEAPVLLALGLKDRRVPPSQGLEYYHALQARGKAARLLTYPEDDHALDTPRTSADHWVEIAAFLEEKLVG